MVKCAMTPLQSTVYNWVKMTGTLRQDPSVRQAGRTQREYITLNNKCMELRKVIVLHEQAPALCPRAHARARPHACTHIHARTRADKHVSCTNCCQSFSFRAPVCNRLIHQPAIRLVVIRTIPVAIVFVLQLSPLSRATE